MTTKAKFLAKHRFYGQQMTLQGGRFTGEKKKNEDQGIFSSFFRRIYPTKKHNNGRGERCPEKDLRQRGWRKRVTLNGRGAVIKKMAAARGE